MVGIISLAEHFLNCGVARLSILCHIYCVAYYWLVTKNWVHIFNVCLEKFAQVGNIYGLIAAAN